MLVDGVPLHKTNIAIDPKTPVKISEVAELFRQQSKYGVVSVRLKAVSYTHLDVYKRQPVDYSNHYLIPITWIMSKFYFVFER